MWREHENKMRLVKQGNDPTATVTRMSLMDTEMPKQSYDL